MKVLSFFSCYAYIFLYCEMSKYRCSND